MTNVRLQLPYAHVKRIHISNGSGCALIANGITLARVDTDHYIVDFPVMYERAFQKEIKKDITNTLAEKFLLIVNNIETQSNAVYYSMVTRSLDGKRVDDMRLKGDNAQQASFTYET
jgi:hypothetical protein